ncbi:MAG: hypothetical protein PVH88_14205 [Ignavibacteria bacterium]|jgi:hypothetical protein
MKKVLILLLFQFILTQYVFCQWSQDEFIIGTFWDPILSTNTDTSDAIVTTHIANFQKARDAHFNLFTGSQDHFNTPIGIVNSQTGMDYALYIASQVSGIRYLVWDRSSTGFYQKNFNSSNANNIVSHYTGLDTDRRNTMYGYHIWDEPFTSNASETKSWVNYLKTNDPDKLAYINLLPIYGFENRTDYEAYLDLYLNDTNTANNPDVVAFDHYPFLSTGTRTDYFYNISIIREKAGSRPFWVYPMSAGHNTYLDPNENHLRFMVFCPIAYGAKGIIYFTYELVNYNSNSTEVYRTALIHETSEQLNYSVVQTINHYITNVLGPVVMNSKHIGAYHVSSNPTGETIPDKELISPNKTPLLYELNDNQLMAGIFQDNSTTTTYYILVINKSLSEITNATVTLKGSYNSGVQLAPLLYNYTGSTNYTSASVSVNSTTNKTEVSLDSLRGGECKLIRIMNVTNIYVPAMKN